MNEHDRATKLASARLKLEVAVAEFNEVVADDESKVKSGKEHKLLPESTPIRAPVLTAASEALMAATDTLSAAAYRAQEVSEALCHADRKWQDGKKESSSATVRYAQELWRKP